MHRRTIQQLQVSFSSHYQTRVILNPGSEWWCSFLNKSCNDHKITSKIHIFFRDWFQTCMDAEDYNHCLFGYKLSESLVKCFEARVDSCHCGLWLWTSFRGTTWMHPTGRATRYDKKGGQVGFTPYPVANLKVDRESYWTCNPLGDWHDWHDWHDWVGG